MLAIIPKNKPTNKIYASIEKPENKNTKKNFWKFKSFLNKENKKEAEILLYGVIGDDGYWDEVTSKEFAEQLKEVEDAETISVRINSPGGDVFAGQAIYSMLKRCKAQIVVYIDGLAASIASLVAMAGDKIIMPKNSMMMIHKPWTISAGNANDMRQRADTLDKVEESMLAAYVEKTGLQLNIFARSDDLSKLETKIMKHTAENFVNYKIYHDNHISLETRITQIDNNVQEVKNLLISFIGKGG